MLSSAAMSEVATIPVILLEEMKPNNMIQCIYRNSSNSPCKKPSILLCFLFFVLSMHLMLNLSTACMWLCTGNNSYQF